MGEFIEQRFRFMEYGHTYRLQDILRVGPQVIPAIGIRTFGWIAEEGKVGTDLLRFTGFKESATGTAGFSDVAYVNITPDPDSSKYWNAATFSKITITVKPSSETSFEFTMAFATPPTNPTHTMEWVWEDFTFNLRVGLFTTRADVINFNDLKPQYLEKIKAGVELYKAIGGDDRIWLPTGTMIAGTNIVWHHLEKFYGGGGNDSITGAPDFANFIDGGEHHDTIFGGTKNDVLDGASGNDQLRGNGGNDLLQGDVGTPYGRGNDALWGGDGDDSLNGGPGSDTLDGGKGNDTIDGFVSYFMGTPTAESNVVRGGEDSDTILYNRNANDYTFTMPFFNNIVVPLVGKPEFAFSIEIGEKEDRFPIDHGVETFVFENTTLKSQAVVKLAFMWLVKETLVWGLRLGAGGAVWTGQFYAIPTLLNAAEAVQAAEQVAKGIITSDNFDAAASQSVGFVFDQLFDHLLRKLGIYGNGSGALARDLYKSLFDKFKLEMKETIQYIDRELLKLSPSDAHARGSSDLSAEDRAHLISRVQAFQKASYLDFIEREFGDLPSWDTRDSVTVKSSTAVSWFSQATPGLVFGGVPNVITRATNDFGIYQLGAGADRLTLLRHTQTLSVDGEVGNDTLQGGVANDRLAGGDGDDRLLGGNGEDVLDGGNGSDTMAGGVGDDYYLYADPSDVLLEHSGEGHDVAEVNMDFTLEENLSIELIQASDGRLNISIHGNSDSNQIEGNEGANKLEGLDGNDTLRGGGGNDVLSGDAGGDRLEGGSNDDRLSGGIGADALAGSTGDDSLEGGSGEDTAFAGVGDDSVRGGSGDDVLKGGSGNDTILGDSGWDRLVGESGFDVFKFLGLDDSGNTRSSADLIIEFQGEATDRIDLSSIDAIEGGEKDAFKFIGEAEFTDIGQVRYLQEGGRTYVELNTRGDIAAEMQIAIDAKVTLDQSDFILGPKAEFGGHSYEAFLVSEPITWLEAASKAKVMGGHLATVQEVSENYFLYGLVSDAPFWFRGYFGPWIGGYESPTGWKWVTGESFDIFSWAEGQPDDAGSGNVLHFYTPYPYREPIWNDLRNSPETADPNVGVTAFIVEYDGLDSRIPKVSEILS